MSETHDVTPALLEIGGRLQKLTYKEMITIADIVGKSLSLNEKERPEVISALLNITPTLEACKSRGLS